MTHQQKLGNRGERIAEAFLRHKGFEYVERNFHAQGGEIDLIMRDPFKKEYVLIEVKTRSSHAFGDGLGAITQTKFHKILKAAEDFFLKKMNMENIPFFRVDAIVVRIDKGKTFIEHIEAIGEDDFS